jgi:hypothetical protein
MLRENAPYPQVNDNRIINPALFEFVIKRECA